MSQQLDQLTAAQLAAMLADIKRECPGCRGTIVNCHHCSGTGQVYIFPDSVRERCIGDWHLDSNGTQRRWCYFLHESRFLSERFPCKTCGNKGFTPSMSLEVWMGARQQLHLRHARLSGGQKHHLFGVSEWWVATYPCNVAEHEHGVSYRPEEATCAKGEAVEPLEAIQRALAAGLEAQGVTL